MEDKLEPAVFPRYTLFDVKVDPGLKDDDGIEFPRPFTKNQMRKWLKKVKWENHKLEKRAKEKARAKQRRHAARAANIDLGPSRKSLKKMKLEKSKQSTGIIIDLSFDSLMIEKDRFKVIKQILRCYSVNRRSQSPLQFHITGFSEKSKNDMSRHNGYENWDIQYHTEDYLNIFPKESLVYLTSESENVIEKFEENTNYIIGGLVDHNKHKGLCYKIAQEQGIRHGQLPLDKYVNMKTRKVLTIDHGRKQDCSVRSKNLPPVPPIHLYGSPLKWVDSFRYLGHVVTSDLMDDADIERERRALSVRATWWPADLLVVQPRVLLGLPRFCSASGMFADARVDCFYTTMRKSCTSLVRRVQASSNGILRAFADRFDFFEIIVKVSDGVPWQETLLQVLPLRKGAHICDNSLSNTDDSEG